MASAAGDQSRINICPSGKRNRRACLLCSLVKTHEQFVDFGCENCDDVIHLKGDADAVTEWTSEVFHGIIAQMNPSRSWVARWQGIGSFVPGCYAVSVSGRIKEDHEHMLAEKGVSYVSRDTSINK